jgi:hypothetical protein
MDIGPDQCRYTVSAPGERHMFCGATVVQGCSWCSRHARVVFRVGAYYAEAAGKYDAQDDLAKSLEVGYAAIRERVASGGPGWEPRK